MRVALVTGAAGGIGRSIAATLARDGYAVMVSDRQAEDLERVVKDLASTAASVDACPFDLSVERGVERLVDRCVSKWGRVDALINNAAYHGRRLAALKLNAGEWRDVFQVNVLAPASLSIAAARHMAIQGGGCIVNIGSVQSSLPVPTYAPYVASKAALEGMTRAFASELGADNIRVNAVLPGVIGTEAFSSELRSLSTHPAENSPASLLRRLGGAEDIAEMVAFLVSPKAAFITGASLVVDGGRQVSRRTDPFQRDPDSGNGREES